MKPEEQPPPFPASGIELQPAFSPGDIEVRSFAIIDAEVPEPRSFTSVAWPVARRIIHAAGDISLASVLHIPEPAVLAGLAALRSGAAIFTDTAMARAGIPMRRLEPLGCSVQCVLDLPLVEEEARRHGTTRVHAGFALLGERLGGSIAVVGNAPTGVLAILEYLDAGGPPPALVIGMPVGFVNAAESKELLLERPDVHSFVLRGRRGGSPLASAAVNALAVLLADEDGRRDPMRWAGK